MNATLNFKINKIVFGCIASCITNYSETYLVVREIMIQLQLFIQFYQKTIDYCCFDLHKRLQVLETDN